MTKLIENVEFRKSRDRFQSILKRDITYMYIRDFQVDFVPADETRNLYRLKKVQYEKLLRENITRHYRSPDQDAYDNINAEVQVIASKLCIADRIDMMAKREASITLKDHNDSFENSLSCRLINPMKSEMGLVSK